MFAHLSTLITRIDLTEDGGFRDERVQQTGNIAAALSPVKIPSYKYYQDLQNQQQNTIIFGHGDLFLFIYLFLLLLPTGGL